nr:choline/ethanolaminephosphotransferase 1-like isoform X1 [Camelus dromedarius]XP_031302580.1 choline/ethanolaminephosphotransferase 1-like isoform X1 [Camelus dromedarius]XP_031302581.1 choline/ethanolaminephosphotransferase 1-like isoform X1 [Camelus dromedarius]XP_031302582.1 choline/ethanolaminephosphotransferase 1-like isoform X1 [Camelus dromedarius]XP_031302843.1 choline/ethanolaminephosphotransferase 1-like isoform X1 [Camelus dromedarius]XP_031302844.1 choline/ethanolaminephosphotra
MSGHRSTRKRCGDSHPESPMGFGHMSTPGCVLNKLFQLPTPPLSRHQLKRLEEHRYQSAGRSLLEPLMQGYWEWLVGRVPSWIAPNLITIIGLSINICTTVLLVFYCPTATEQAPLWAYIACACGLFIYQSLDAIDGKQARRTNSSSPLGELFDHGCDSLSTVFVVLGTCIAVQLGTNPDWMFFCCFAGTFMFYCAHWQTYVSGTLRFGIFDVTESQIIIIICQLLTGTLGPWFWNFTVTARIFMLSSEQWRELNKDSTFVMHRVIKKQKFESLPGGISQTNRLLENR